MKTTQTRQRKTVYVLQIEQQMFGTGWADWTQAQSVESLEKIDTSHIYLRKRIVKRTVTDVFVKSIRR